MKIKETIYADRWVNGSGFKTEGSILNAQIIEFDSLESVLKISRHNYDEFLSDLAAEENGDIRIIVNFYDVSDDNDDDNDNIVHHLEWWMGDEDDEDAE